MLYQNPGGESRERAMIAAYALIRNFGAKQADVARVLNCSQSTISQWVKEIEMKKQISGLEKELSDAQDYIAHLSLELDP